MIRVRSFLDRYPAKMISHLADKLVARYGSGCDALVDPFCGSGAILVAGKKKGIDVTGYDINPYAVLLSSIKVNGFDGRAGRSLCLEFLRRAKKKKSHTVQWTGKNFWFTPATIRKYEQLRYAALQMRLNESPEGRAVLLSFALSIRRCSRADQRSPKPFVSKTAIKERKGLHFDPLWEIDELHKKLTHLYGTPARGIANIECLDITAMGQLLKRGKKYPLAITSPPYLNAQDYFRNFKLELHLLEQLLPFQVEQIRTSFIGTERGALLRDIDPQQIEHNLELMPKLRTIGRRQPRLCAVVHRYLFDMGRAFDAVKASLLSQGVLVLACGNNLVAGVRVSTWRTLTQMLEQRGFVLFDRFGDQIDRRWVPPSRNGHKGLIKEEVISAFRLP